MTRTWSAARRAGALATLALGLAACSFIRRTMELPSPDEGARREAVRLGVGSCLLTRCRQEVKVGAERLQVETRVQALPLRDLPGADGGSVAGRAAVGAAKWTMRQFGVTTVEHLVHTGTLTVSGTANGGWRATCEIAWIDEWSRRRGEQSDSLLRVADGLDCRVAADTSLVRWRFRRGMAPTPDSIGAVLDTIAWTDGRRLRQAQQMALVRHGDAPRGAGDYTIAEDTSAPDWMWRPALWRVARPDGVPIAALHWGMGAMLPHALDLTAAASGDEAAVLRLIAAAVIAPTVNP
jgi:hypothetical protein